MEDIIKALAIIAILLAIGPLSVLCALIGVIPLSLLGGQDIPLDTWWKRLGTAMFGMVAWGIILYGFRFLLCLVIHDVSICPATPTPTPTAVPTPTITPTATLTPTSISSPCFCQSATDDDTLRCLIHAESEAVKVEDLSLIRRIFAPNATIFRGDTQEEWRDPIAYYEQHFAILDFPQARHFDISPVVIAADFAKYTSGSSGQYTTGVGTPTPYYNPNPSDHWVFVKNERGCWVIQRFEFNASHIPFP